MGRFHTAFTDELVKLAKTRTLISGREVTPRPKLALEGGPPKGSAMARGARAAGAALRPGGGVERGARSMGRALSAGPRSGAGKVRLKPRAVTRKPAKKSRPKIEVEIGKAQMLPDPKPKKPKVDLKFGKATVVSKPKRIAKTKLEFGTPTVRPLKKSKRVAKTRLEFGKATVQPLRRRVSTARTLTPAQLKKKIQGGRPQATRTATNPVRPGG